MQEFFKKVKDFFKDILNIVIIILVVLFFVLVLIPSNEITAKLAMAALAGALAVVAYKFLKKHQSMKDVYNNIDSARQPKKESAFSRIGNKIEGLNRTNYLLYAILFGGIATIIAIYVLFK